ncbi:type II toxin-antitoxin system MqsA family antitoxin [Candidatus Poribacteria bacterium]|nr:type II toxin-antitoxin system MqsA family antitoxin [Candidatus Poribacteria bacterium]
MKHQYGDCQYCSGEVTEQMIEIDFRWKGQFYLFENIPVGVCEQCGEKYFTAEVSEKLDRLVQSPVVHRTVTVPVKNYALFVPEFA